MAKIYKQFAPKDYELDWSKEAAEEMFKYESTGKGNLEMNPFSTNMINGYALGKKHLDLRIKSWQEDKEWYMG